MAESQSAIDLDTFRRYDVPALKQYLKSRNISVVGRKDVLVARAFAAHEANIPISLTKGECERILEKEYQILLETELEGKLPDPMYDLVEGWLNEETGKKHWPPCFIEDISFFLVKSERIYEKVSLAKRLLSDYKEQKAFSYFKSKFLYEVCYHQITPDSIHCFLRAKCTPSMRLREIPHDTWACIRKDTGEVHSAYCTCFAGLGQTCNHVAAVLFRVDAAWKSGEITSRETLACTSTLCQWNVPAFKVEPMRVCDMNICKPKALRTTAPWALNSATKQLFGRPKIESGMSENEFLNKLAEISPNSVTLGERGPQRNLVYVKYDQQQETCDAYIPPSIVDLAAECVSVEELYKKMDETFTPNTSSLIEQATTEQGGQFWEMQRRGRITASKFHRVHTRMKSYAKDSNINMEPLICDIMQYNPPPSGLPALKYGRRMEGIAADKYKNVLVELGHKNVQVRKCGLFISSSVPFIGASPDRIVSCVCCGERVLEIKCPLKSAHTHPTQETVDCLQFVDGILKLKTNHNYYTQIQGQMALTNIKRAHFFIFSVHGYHLQEVVFDEAYWEEVSPNLSIFFNLFLAEELVTKIIQKNIDAVEKPNQQCDVSHDLKLQCASLPKNRFTKPEKKKRKGKTKAPKVTPVYLCGQCHERTKDENEISGFSEYSIYCDKCSKWFHMACLGLTEDSSDLEDEKYYCPTCKFSSLTF